MLLTNIYTSGHFLFSLYLKKKNSCASPLFFNQTPFPGQNKIIATSRQKKAVEKSWKNYKFQAKKLDQNLLKAEKKQKKIGRGLEFPDDDVEDEQQRARPEIRKLKKSQISGQNLLRPKKS